MSIFDGSPNERHEVGYIGHACPKVIYLRVPESLRNSLMAIAKEHNTSINALLHYALDKAVRQHKAEKRREQPPRPNFQETRFKEFGL